MIDTLKTCEYKGGCTNPATTLAKGRRDGWSSEGEHWHDLGSFCKAHARLVADEGDPEYIVDCPQLRLQIWCELR